MTVAPALLPRSYRISAVLMFVVAALFPIGTLNRLYGRHLEFATLESLVSSRIEGRTTTNAWVSGRFRPSDGFEGSFIWMPADSTPTNSGTVFASKHNNGENGRWKRVVTGARQVNWFGSFPNDEIDDQSGVQAAIDSASPFSTIEFSNGVYKIGEGNVSIRVPLTLKLSPGTVLELGCSDPGRRSGGINVQSDSVRIVGEAGATIRQKDGRNIQTLIQIGKSREFAIEGVRIDGNEANQMPQPRGSSYNVGLASLAGAARIVVRNCEFTAAGDRAIDFRGSSEIEISGCRFVRTGIDVVHNGMNEGNAISCDLDGTGVMCENIRIVNNYFQEFGDVAIGVPHARGATIANNIIIGATLVGRVPTITETGISINGASETVASGNVIRGVRNKGITAQDKLTQGRHYAVRNVLIVGNTLVCEKEAETTIHVRPNSTTNSVATSVVIAGNTVDLSANTTATAIYVSGKQSGHIVVSGNAVTAQVCSPRQVGIKFTGGNFEEDVYTIVGNSIKNLGTGLQFDGGRGGSGGVTGNVFHNTYVPIDNVRNGTSISGNYGYDHILFSEDNTFDIGRSGLRQRPRNLFLGSNLEMGGGIWMDGSINRLTGKDVSITACDVGPNGAVVASAGSIALNVKEGRGPRLFLKDSGDGSDGWIPLFAARNTSQEWSPGTIAPADWLELLIDVEGVSVGQPALVGLMPQDAGQGIDARVKVSAQVTSNDKIRVVLENSGDVAIDVPPLVVNLVVLSL